MKSSYNPLLLLFACLLLSVAPAIAQNHTKTLSVSELFELTRQNHPNLKISRADVDIARQNIAVAKAQQWPTLSIGAQASYIGDAFILNKNLGDGQRVDMPHFGNSFSVEASQLIWKGNTMRHNVQIQSLKEDLAELSYTNNEQNIKLLVLGYYLDLYKVINQESVYGKNIALAKQRLENSNRLYQEGMVTRNDVIRGELQLSNLQLALETLQHNRQILNKQLTVALGLPETTQILPDSTLLQSRAAVAGLNAYTGALADHPAIRMSEKAIQTYQVAGQIISAERMPYLVAFAGNQLARPITTATPALDRYSNGWSAGLSIGLDLDAFYKTPQKLKANKYEQQRAQAQLEETKELLQVAVHAAYIKYEEAVRQHQTYDLNKNLAAENYRIMESKYNNQLAILLDLIDASNAKLDAELQYANAEANIIFSFYKLLKESGTL